MAAAICGANPYSAVHVGASMTPSRPMNSCTCISPTSSSPISISTWTRDWSGGLVVASRMTVARRRTHRPAPSESVRTGREYERIDPARGRWSVAGACRFTALRSVQIHGFADQRPEGVLVDLLALADVDCAPDLALEARVEQPRRVLQRSAFEERELHDAPVRLAGADPPVV